MTTIDANSPASTAVDPPVDNYLTFTRGILSWVFTLDHKRIGVMYLVAVLSSFFVGGVFALLVRTELLTPGATIPWVDANTYNEYFTLHGAIMVFLVIIPSIPAASEKQSGHRAGLVGARSFRTVQTENTWDTASADPSGLSSAMAWVVSC